MEFLPLQNVEGFLHHLKNNVMAFFLDVWLNFIIIYKAARNIFGVKICDYAWLFYDKFQEWNY